MSLYYTHLSDRAVLSIQGEDRLSFLQNLVSNDIARVNESQTVYTTLLSPQGRFLFDFIVSEASHTYFLDCDVEQIDDLKKRLSLYQLRSKVSIQKTTASIYAVWGEDTSSTFQLENKVGSTRNSTKTLFYMDPRLTDLGARIISPIPIDNLLSAIYVSKDEYDQHRLKLGVPQGKDDLIPNKSFLLESNIEQLNGISWTKGCYIGQELTARTRYQGLVRKRLFPVIIEGTAPLCRTPLFLEGVEAGEMRSHNGKRGLALIQLEAYQQAQNLQISFKDMNGTLFKPYQPDWLKLT